MGATDEKEEDDGSDSAYGGGVLKMKQVKKFANRAFIGSKFGNCRINHAQAIATLVIVFALAAAFPGLVQATAAAEPAENARWQDYNGKRIGVLTGPLMEDAAAEYFPDSEQMIFNSYPDCVTALLSGKIDGYLGDEPSMKTLHAERPEIDYIHDRITENNYSFAFRKNDPASAALCEELNEFLEKCWSDGTMQELDEIWFGVDEEKKVVDMSGLDGKNGTVKVVTTSTDMPFSYIKDGKNVGYDIDLVVRFCRDRGYALELGDVDFAGRIPAIESGKYDFTTDMNVTPEREEEVLFSKPTSKGGIVLAVLAKDLEEYGTKTEGTGTYQYLEELDGKKIGVQTGTSFDKAISDNLPDAEILYFNTKADLINALQSNKIDAYAVDEPVVKTMMQQDDGLTYVPEYLESFDFAYVFPKSDGGKKLQGQFNEYLSGIRENGELEEIEAKWLSEGEAGKMVLDYASLPSPNGTLHMATEALYEPFTYIVDGEIVGYDIDIAARFCEKYGYGLEITDMNFDAILPSVQSGKYDFGGAGITITEERAESVLFSEPNYSGGTVLAILKAQNAGDSGGFLSSIGQSFEKTFIRENRYRLFAEGVANTLIITVLSILLGTALGFFVFMLCRKGNIAANSITNLCVWLVQGTPMVVLLMILYYIVFAHVAVSGVSVAVIGFTLTFGAAVYGMLLMGVGAVDAGQYEAAYALGHTNRHTFFRIILPQAIPHVMGAYRGEIVGLVKATAIVGYIAVQDLTKMGDIVRSRTYEAFFPLIAVTIIYFALEAVLGFLVGRVQAAFDPKRRTREQVLKGVRADDKD